MSKPEYSAENQEPGTVNKAVAKVTEIFLERLLCILSIRKRARRYLLYEEDAIV
jgi:hypothetical protein